MAATLLPAALFITGCTRVQGGLTSDVDPSGWSAGSPVEIVFDNADTLRTLDLSVVMRYDRAAGGNALPLSIHTLTPDSLAFTEDIEMPLPAHGKGGCNEAAMLYRSGVVLSRTGKYYFEISPLRPAKGVHAVGLEFREDGQR